MMELFQDRNWWEAGRIILFFVWLFCIIVLAGWLDRKTWRD